MEGDQTNAMSPSLLHSQRQQYPLIGYYLSRKKFSKLRFDQFLLRCKNYHIDTVELTPDYFERSDARIPQLIIHKLEDDAPSRILTETFLRLPKLSTIILDEFDSVSKLMNRYEQYALLDSNKRLYVVPPFTCISNDDNKVMIEKKLMHNHIKFPIMCKPIPAHGDKSHDMKIIFDVQHLDDIDKPCVLQQFVDHDGVLFKVFAIGRDNYHIVQRNSIRNLDTYPSRETISFHSSEVSSSQADHILLAKDESISVTCDHRLVNEIVQTVQSLFQLNLVGVDVIIDKNTGDYAVIDVNYFPGYEGITDFSTQLFDLCQHLLHIS